MEELSNFDRGDENDSIKFSEMVYGRYFRVVFIGSTLFALQQLFGINAIFYFSSTVYRSAGVSSNVANIFIGLANLLGSIIALILMDKLGRKALLVWSFSGMAISMALQVAAAGLSASGDGALYLSVGGMLLFVFTFAIGAGPVSCLLLAEVFNFLMGLLFLSLLEQLGQRLLYSIFWHVLLDGGCICKQKCDENKRKITTRNRDSSSSRRIKVFPSCTSVCTSQDDLSLV